VKDPDKVRIDEDLYTNYMNLFKTQTPYKRTINSQIRTFLPEVKDILGAYFEQKLGITKEQLKNKSLNKEFSDHVEVVIERGINIIGKYGAIPYNYKPMGNSPRIIPVNYGQSINNTKRLIRDDVYNRIATLNKDYVVVDFDLKSCYTSILLGLYPKEMSSVQLAIEKTGLWEFIREEFKRNGVESQYKKSAVKICVYSSFFLGGNKAMNEGIIDSMREDIGMTKDTFRKSEFYEKAYKTAQEVTNQMQNSAIIQDFRTVAKYIHETHENEYLIGPTGHKYLVNDETFRVAYPNYLISYEFYLIANGTLRTAKEFPEIEFVGHYHDGNTLAIPKDQYKEVVSCYDKHVSDLGKELNLAYPQTMEVK